MDPELKEQLQIINSQLESIKKKTGQGIARSFFNGMFGALGYIAGLAIVLVVLGWFLNKTGLLPAFKKQVSDFQGIIDSARQLTTGSKEKLNSLENQTIVLPNGQEVKLKTTNTK
jgi:hypothetical protein